MPIVAVGVQVDMIRNSLFLEWMFQLFYDICERFISCSWHIIMCALLYYSAKKQGPPASRDEQADVWKARFIQAPYARDVLALQGVLVETFETAVVWSK